KAKTDPEPLPGDVAGRESRPEARNLVSIYAALAGTSAEAVLAEFEGKGFGAFKPALADLTVSVLAPIAARFRELCADPGHLDAVLAKGAARADAIAAPVLAEVKRTVGFLG
ncbi:MAG: tryptophan--tRNA ligase, partial [Sphingomonadaceae bacterium]|nr:tryptophan--tRNA ligase [Sphingomonadaceae bacterium]